jgi:hypothetical protein
MEARAMSTETTHGDAVVLEFFDVPKSATNDSFVICGECGAAVAVGYRQKHAEFHGKEQWVYGDW